MLKKKKNKKDKKRVKTTVALTLRQCQVVKHERMVNFLQDNQTQTGNQMMMRTWPARRLATGEFLTSDLGIVTPKEEIDSDVKRLRGRFISPTQPFTSGAIGFAVVEAAIGAGIVQVSAKQHQIVATDIAAPATALEVSAFTTDKIWFPVRRSWLSEKFDSQFADSNDVMKTDMSTTKPKSKIVYKNKT